MNLISSKSVSPNVQTIHFSIDVFKNKQQIKSIDLGLIENLFAKLEYFRMIWSRNNVTANLEEQCQWEASNFRNNSNNNNNNVFLNSFA